MVNLADAFPSFRVFLVGGSVALSFALGSMPMTAASVSAQENRTGDSVQRVLDRARAAQLDPANEAYAGWLAYLSWRIEHWTDRTPEVTRNLRGAVRYDISLDYKSVDELLSTLTEWLDRIDSDPKALAKLRGLFEWAHLSKVDGTGQPFIIAIPDDYDPERAWPLHVELHAFGRGHRREGKMPASVIFLRPLGRNRGGVWHALSEVDVIEALDYVRSQWHVDQDRIHLDGCSMGGYGT